MALPEPLPAPCDTGGRRQFSTRMALVSSLANFLANDAKDRIAGGPILLPAMLYRVPLTARWSTIP